MICEKKNNIISITANNTVSKVTKQILRKTVKLYTIITSYAVNKFLYFMKKM